MNRVSSALLAIAVSFGSAALALAVSYGIIAATGGDPNEAARALWDGAFGSRAQVAGTLSELIPLVLVALGWIVAFSARRINIGFEGQILVGGACATWVALNVSLPHPLHLGLATAAGVLGGAAWVGIAAWLWAKRSVNEIISTLMLNFVAIQLISWLVRGPLQEETRGFPRSAAIPESARWPKLLVATPLAWDLILALAMVVAMWFLLRRTSFGFAVRLTGANEVAAPSRRDRDRPQSPWVPCSSQVDWRDSPERRCSSAENRPA